MVYECFECSTNIPSGLSAYNPLETCVLLLLYNNSKDARFFRGFTGTITHSWLTNQSARIDLVIIYINNSRHLARKYARIFVRGHYLFREANSFPRVKLEENCELQKEQINIRVYFAPNRGYCLYYASNLFRNARSFENWGIFSDIPQFSLGNIRSRD